VKTPIYYTFGNHMHWVDMEWLWGYDALPGSIRDMLSFCAQSGARGNINFDAAGYEKLAAEAPQALAELRAAVAAGQIEVVGGSYGQPYGLFQGGESNIRQRVYGVRSVCRTLGVRPRTFWEEEFDFFPQLPQILAGAGFRYASLFFQWTWHTPMVPEESLPAIWWEGLDGSRLLTAPRTALCLHQWPEDVAALLQSQPVCDAPARGIVQWLELLPSPDWMCRAELMLPPLRTLLANTSCEVLFGTLSEFLEAMRPYAEVRRYTLDDMYHGVSLGKNGDILRRASRRAEQALLAAESAAAIAGLFGRPYASWDVYPVWELEEGWRQLLAAQHHDNDECEGLCGHIGRLYYQRSLAMAEDVAARTVRLLAERAKGPAGRTLVFNPLGWRRRAVCFDPVSGRDVLLEDLPPFGYRLIDEADRGRALPTSEAVVDEASITLRRGSFSVTVDRGRGTVTQITGGAGAPCGAGFLRPGRPLADLQMRRGGEVEDFPECRVSLGGAAANPEVLVERRGRDGALVRVTVALARELDAVDLRFSAQDLPRPDGGVAAALRTNLAPDLPGCRLIHDHPFGVSEIRAQGVYRRKYPTGDWMTSPQVFEEVRGPFTALQLLDFDAGERGLLYLHDGSQAMQREDAAGEGTAAGGRATTGARGPLMSHILTLYDPWDGDYFVGDVDVRVRLVPHGPLSHAQRWRLAQEFTRPVLAASTQAPGGDLPPQFAGIGCDGEDVPSGVVISALYREAESAGAGFESYAGVGIQFPYVLRLVELNGEPATCRLHLPGPMAAAFLTNLLGERLADLPATPDPGRPGWEALRVDLHPHEIATLYLDLVAGRKVVRGLDASRPVWATIHRSGMEGAAS
jgi:alpha-mannosidase